MLLNPHSHMSQVWWWWSGDALPPRMGGKWYMVFKHYMITSRTNILLSLCGAIPWSPRPLFCSPDLPDPTWYPTSVWWVFCDGASIMLVRRAGVASQCRARLTVLFLFHCLNHCLWPTVGDALKEASCCFFVCFFLGGFNWENCQSCIEELQSSSGARFCCHQGCNQAFNEERVTWCSYLCAFLILELCTMP